MFEKKSVIYYPENNSTNTIPFLNTQNILLTQLIETNTISPKAIPSLTATKNKTNNVLPYSITVTDLYNKLDSGLYIGYEIGDEVHIKDIYGNELGLWMTINGGLVNSISPDGKLLEIYINTHIPLFQIGIYNLFSQNRMNIFDYCPIDTGYGLGWSSDSQRIAMSECNFPGISILDIYSGELIASINSPVVLQNNSKHPDLVNPYPGNPFWSQNGKWIAYFVYYIDEWEWQQGTGALLEYPHGPYITDATCITNDTTCSNKSHMLINSIHYYSGHESLLTWISDNELAILPTHMEPIIYIYNVLSSQLEKRIVLPYDLGLLENLMIGSPDGKFILFEVDPNIPFLLSIQTQKVIQISDEKVDSFFWIYK